MMGISRATVHRYCATGKFRCVRLNRKIFIRKKDIDALFDNAELYEVMPVNRAPITEFYTMQEITEKFEVSESTVYNMVIAKQIPKALSQGKTIYSKKHIDRHFDRLVREKQLVPEYYTVEEAMAKYNLTRDTLYHHIRYNDIPKIKDGRYIKISKPELDAIFEQPITI